MADGFTTADKLCTTPALKEACTKYGVQLDRCTGWGLAATLIPTRLFLPLHPVAPRFQMSSPEVVPHAPPSGEPLLSLRGIDKSFGAVQVLRDVDLDVYSGQVTALVGDNGAGKSTLIKGVAGIHAFDSGDYIFDGEHVTVHDPKAANALGIEVVYQDLALCNNLDVVDNMFLGRETLRHGSR